MAKFTQLVGYKLKTFRHDGKKVTFVVFDQVPAGGVYTAALQIDEYIKATIQAKFILVANDSKKIDLQGSLVENPNLANDDDWYNILPQLVPDSNATIDRFEIEGKHLWFRIKVTSMPTDAADFSILMES